MKKCTCETFQQTEGCEHIGQEILNEVGLGEWINVKFKTLKEARKYAKKIGGRRIIFTTEENNYLVV